MSRQVQGQSCTSSQKWRGALTRLAPSMGFPGVRGQWEGISALTLGTGVRESLAKGLIKSLVWSTFQ